MNFETGFTCCPGHYGNISSQNALSLQVCDEALRRRYSLRSVQKVFRSFFKAYLKKKKLLVSSVVVFIL